MSTRKPSRRKFAEDDVLDIPLDGGVVYFDLVFEEYNFEEDLRDTESSHHEEALEIERKLEETRGQHIVDMEWAAYQEMKRLLESGGLRVSNEGHYHDNLICRVGGIDTLKDLENIQDLFYDVSRYYTEVPYFKAALAYLFPDGRVGTSRPLELYNGELQDYIDHWKEGGKTARRRKRAYVSPSL